MILDSPRLPDAYYKTSGITALAFSIFSSILVEFCCSTAYTQNLPDNLELFGVTDEGTDWGVKEKTQHKNKPGIPDERSRVFQCSPDRLQS